MIWLSMNYRVLIEIDFDSFFTCFFSHLKSIVYQHYNRINMANVEFGQFWMSRYSWNTDKLVGFKLQPINQFWIFAGIF